MKRLAPMMFAFGALLIGLGMLIAHQALFLTIATLLYVGAVYWSLTVWLKAMREVQRESQRLTALDVARRAEFFTHMKQQLMVARRISDAGEYRKIIESLLESFGVDPHTFQGQIAYLQEELGSL